VPTVLPPILHSSGHIIDLRVYSCHGKQNTCRNHNNRRLRVGIDVSGWIQKACFGFSDILACDEYMTNHGRAALAHETQPKISNGMFSSLENGSVSDGERDDAILSHTCRPRKRKISANIGVIDVHKFVNKCISFVLNRLKVLRDDCGIEVLVVFEGQTPPLKKNTVEMRHKNRNQYARFRDRCTESASLNLEADFLDTMTDGLVNPSDLESRPDSAIEQWFTSNRRAGAGRHLSTIVEQLIVLLRQEKISFLVAPYEADSQLAFLGRHRYIDMVITDDSDLIVVCDCPIIYKLFEQFDNPSKCIEFLKETDRFIPIGIMLRPREDLGSLTFDIGGNATILNLQDYTPSMLATLFVALGSDYEGSSTKLKGIGVVSACRHVRDSFFGTPSSKKSNENSPLQRLFSRLLAGRNHTVDFDNYIHQFMSAIIMYRHPVVYDPLHEKCVVLGVDSNEDTELMQFEAFAVLANNRRYCCQKVTGELLPSSVAKHVAEGWISPRTLSLYKEQSAKEHIRTTVNRDCEKYWIQKCDA
jgi:5'-3' exonuclease